MPKLMNSLEELRRIAGRATQVVAWYPHSEDGTVRGPFHRWFKCAEVDGRYKNCVADTTAEVEFAAAAMNNLVPLLDKVDELESKIADLQLELILMDRIVE